MAYTAKLLSIMAVGILVGILVNKKGKKTGNDFGWLSKASGKVQTFVVIYLLFILGTRIGSDEQVFAELDRLWIVALVITVAAMATGVLLVHILRKVLKFEFLYDIITIIYIMGKEKIMTNSVYLKIREINRLNAESQNTARDIATTESIATKLQEDIATKKSAIQDMQMKIGKIKNTVNKIA